MKNILIAFLVFLPQIAFGSDKATGKITIIGGQYVSPQSIYFGLSVEPQKRPPCSTNSSYWYILDPNTEEGKALYSALLYAKAADKNVAVRGTGNCILNQPMESISYWALKD